MFTSDLRHITLTDHDIQRLPGEQRRVVFDESQVHVDMKVGMDVSGAKRRRRVGLGPKGRNSRGSWLVSDQRVC